MTRSNDPPIALKTKTQNAALEALAKALTDEDRIVVNARPDPFEEYFSFVIAVRGITGARGFIETLVRIDRELGHNDGVWMEVTPRWLDDAGCDFEAFPDWIFFDVDLRGAQDQLPSDDLLRSVATAVRRGPDFPRGNYWKIRTDPTRDAPPGFPESSIDPDLLPVVLALTDAHVVVPDVPRDHGYLGDLLYVATCDMEGVRRFVTAIRRVHDAMGSGKDAVYIEVELEWEESWVPHCDFGLWPQWLFFKVRLSTGPDTPKDDRRTVLQRVARAIRPSEMLH
jgi:hypothetical protein